MEKKLRKSKVISNLIGISEPNFFKWKKKYPNLILLLESYFKVNDFIEFQKTQKIERLDRNNQIIGEFFENSLVNFFKHFQTPLVQLNADVIIFYFNFLSELKKANKNESSIEKRETKTSFIFSPSFYLVDINLLINMFTIYYFKNKMDVIPKAYKIFKKLDFLKKWDYYTLFFIKECIENNFFNLYNHKYYNASAEEKKEAFYHIIGFHIFSDDKYTNIEDENKLNKINEIFEDYKKLPFQTRYTSLKNIFVSLKLLREYQNLDGLEIKF